MCNRINIIVVLIVFFCLDRFLRREKDIAETKLDIVQAESKTVRQQLERVQRSLEEANDTIREERENSQVTPRRSVMSFSCVICCEITYFRGNVIFQKMCDFFDA